MTAAASPAPPHHTGHRDRLRERFFTAGAGALQDYEVLEMLLFAAIPRRDTKPLAKQLLTEFGDLWSLTHSTPERLRKFGLSDAAIALLLICGDLALRSQRHATTQQPILNSWQRIVDYCRAAMAHDTREQFRLLFLNRKNMLLFDEVHQTGTIDHAAVYPREVVKRALEVGAGALVLVHNH
ncbi:MAG: DNA repair protein RadC, partial [Proteobacteria bacterium]|nr:DNA repair protein RadC [Pseudomonadota bacterium]